MKNVSICEQPRWLRVIVNVTFCILLAFYLKEDCTTRGEGHPCIHVTSKIQRSGTASHIISQGPFQHSLFLITLYLILSVFTTSDEG